MKLSPTITLAEMVAILRVDLGERFGCEVMDITVESHGKPVLTIDAFDMVEGADFRHSAK